MMAPLLPTLIVCVTACLVIVGKWQQGSRGSIWALIGFGLAVMLGIASPVVQTLFQSLIVGNSQQAAVRIMSIYRIAASILHAASYLFLLIAVFAGRPLPDPANVSSQTQGRF